MLVEDNLGSAAHIDMQQCRIGMGHSSILQCISGIMSSVAEYKGHC